VNVFPNGVDTRPVEKLEPKKIESPLRLITVSRLAPNKRIDHAIKTLKVLQQRSIAARLTIVGSGDIEKELKQLAVNTGTASAIEFAGKLTEAEKNLRLQHAHVLLHTSVREGWGLNVIEANAMGTPAIVYPVAGLVDSTVHNETGIVTDTETPEAVADALARIARSSDNYERLRLNAWNRSKTFVWKEVLPPVCDWLEQQAAKTSR
jgi:glycosyltransferase involved in cell wall biosynthesis